MRPGNSPSGTCPNIRPMDSLRPSLQQLPASYFIGKNGFPGPLHAWIQALVSADPVPNRILVVDDDRAVADTLVLALRIQGFNARAAYCGEDAAELALSWRPEAVVTDVVMGSVDGTSLAIHLSQALQSCTVLRMSGHLAIAELLNKLKNGGQNFPFLAKPFRPKRILDFLCPTTAIGEA